MPYIHVRVILPRTPPSNDEDSLVIPKEYLVMTWHPKNQFLSPVPNPHLPTNFIS